MLQFKPNFFITQYLYLSSGIQNILLNDIQAVGLDAPIVKIASRGLEEIFGASILRVKGALTGY
jgi:hypothetical protein